MSEEAIKIVESLGGETASRRWKLQKAWRGRSSGVWMVIYAGDKEIPEHELARFHLLHLPQGWGFYPPLKSFLRDQGWSRSRQIEFAERCEKLLVGARLDSYSVKFSTRAQALAALEVALPNPTLESATLNG